MVESMSYFPLDINTPNLDTDPLLQSSNFLFLHFCSLSLLLLSLRLKLSHLFLFTSFYLLQFRLKKIKSFSSK